MKRCRRPFSTNIGETCEKPTDRMTLEVAECRTYHGERRYHTNEDSHVVVRVSGSPSEASSG